MSFLGRNGQVFLTLTAGQSLAVASYGPGATRISTAAYSNSSIPPIYGLYATVTGGSTYLTFAAATNIMIDAANGCDIEYDYGSQPVLTANPFAVATGLIARAGGSQANATPLIGNVNRISTTATAGDSVLLPPATIGKRVSVYNAGAASSNVFPQTGENINSGAANAAFAVATTKGAIFECVATGVWNAVLSA